MKCSFLFLLCFILNHLAGQSVDSLAIKQVDSLIQVSQDLTTKRSFDQALEVNATAEKLALEKLGRVSTTYGRCCHSRGMLNFYKGDYPESEKWYLEAIAIREKTLGREHPGFASTLNNLANLYSSMGHYEKAETLYLEAIAIREKTLGREHPDCTGSLLNLAGLYSNKGNYEKAELLYLEIKAIREILGKEHPGYARVLNNLAKLYSEMVKYEKAETLYLEAISIREKTLGREHPDFANSLTSLAILYWKLGNYEKAEPLYNEAKVIQEKYLGRENPEYANTLNNLAILYRQMGDYEKAEKFCLESKEIKEKTLGKEDPSYAKSLNNLAVLYVDMGNLEKAELLYLEAKAIQEKNLGKDHTDYAASLNNLADLYWNMTNYEKAETLYLEAKAIRKEAFGKEHPEYAQSLHNLANLYLEIGNYEKAEPLFHEAKAIREKILGKEHPNYATSLDDLSEFYRKKGNYEKAEYLCLEAKAIRKKALGMEHPDYDRSLYNLTSLYSRMGQFVKSESCYLEQSNLNKLRIEKAIHHLSERELNNFLSLFLMGQNQMLYFTQNSKSNKMVSACFDNSLFYKGFLLNASNQLKRLALSDSSSTEKYNLLKSYERRLAKEYSKPIAERDSANVAKLESNVNDLEKHLARTVAGFGEAIRQVNWQEVQQVLNEEEAAVEFVHYRFYDKNETDSVMYAAIILRKEMTTPVFISLFEQRSLDSLLKVQNERKADYVNYLYTLADRGAQSMAQARRSLYELIWKPLEKELKDVKTVYYSPSGLLHRLNIGAIPIDAEATLADRYQVISLNSTRQLVISSSVVSEKNDAVLFGGLEYEVDSLSPLNEPLLAHRSRGEISFDMTDSTLRGGSWYYLSGTEKEVKSIGQIMKTAGMETVIKTGQQGTEESIKKLADNKRSPRILHIATHGYFFPDAQKEVGNNEPIFKMSEHPMLRSGLILSGGNAGWQGKRPLGEGEDGVLTAYEISQMNLSNTELVVLSACETGLGDIQGNEGVYGLQRAFKIAGVKYIIMSLWQVPDKQTSMLMITFYKKWLDAEGSPTGEKKMSIPDAFHAAQKELRDLGLDPY